MVGAVAQRSEPFPGMLAGRPVVDRARRAGRSLAAPTSPCPAERTMGFPSHPPHLSPSPAILRNSPFRRGLVRLHQFGLVAYRSDGVYLVGPRTPTSLQLPLRAGSAVAGHVVRHIPR